MTDVIEAFNQRADFLNPDMSQLIGYYISLYFSHLMLNVSNLNVYTGLFATFVKIIEALLGHRDLLHSALHTADLSQSAPFRDRTSPR